MQKLDYVNFSLSLSKLNYNTVYFDNDFISLKNKNSTIFTVKRLHA